MSTFAPIDFFRFPRLRRLGGLADPRCVGALFAALMVFQALGYWLLGTGPAGMGVSEIIIILGNLLALACVWRALRRAEGTATLFWLLFAVSLLILLIPALLLLVTTVFHRALVSESTWRGLWCLYGAPILMMLFLPDVHRRTRLKAEIFLDLFQVALVVGLTYSTFFYLPLQRMLPSEALLRNLNVSNLLSLFLLSAIFVRLRFAHTQATCGLLHRLGMFVLVCAIVTLIGNWIDLHHYRSAAAWFDLGWDLPLAAAALVALTWKPDSETESALQPVRFLNLLGKNLVLVAVLTCINLLMDRWKEAGGETVASGVVVATLVAFTWRLALTQYHQQQEILQRETAQYELFAANETIGGHPGRISRSGERDHADQRARQFAPGLRLARRSLSHHPRTHAPALSRHVWSALAAQRYREPRRVPNRVGPLRPGRPHFCPGGMLGPAPRLPSRSSRWGVCALLSPSHRRWRFGVPSADRQR